MDTRTLSDSQLVELLEGEESVSRNLIDEYYRRCIPIYLDFLGIHWHTGFYREQDTGVSPLDQERMVDHIAGLVGISEHDHVLDVGCGIGASVVYLNLKYSCRATGLTPVREQKLLAEKLARGKGAEISIDLGHAESLPYPDNSFDVVCFFESSCHFADRQQFFHEVFRVLKPGGRLVGEDWLATDLSDLTAAEKWIEPICKTWAIPMLGDPEEYQTLLKSASLADVEVADMQTLMPLHKGFAVTDKDQQILNEEIEDATSPLLRLTLKGLVELGKAMAAGAFSIGQIRATKPMQTE